MGTNASGDEHLPCDIQEAVEAQGLLEEVVFGASWRAWVGAHEHDAGIDGGALYREHFGETTYAFDHKGVHFVALDNVSRARPEVGP